MPEDRPRNWLGRGMLAAFGLALTVGISYLLNASLAVALVLWAVLGAIAVGLLELAHRLLRQRQKKPAEPASEPPKLRMDDHLTPDTATRHHAVYFRLRLWNDGGGEITPEVRVTRVLLGEELKEAPFAAQLPLLLPWSSLPTAPALTRQQTAGETVGVLGALNSAEMGDGREMPLAPPLLYVAGAAHSPEIGQVLTKVYIKVQAFVPGKPQLPNLEEWFWVHIAADNLKAAYYVTDGHLSQEPQTTPKAQSPSDRAAEDEVIAKDLLNLLNERFAEIPLSGAERSAVLHVLRQAITNIDDLPFTGEEGQDITYSGMPRDERIWELHLNTAKAYAGGIIRSDGTYTTLRDLYTKLKQVRKEVHRRYHPPTMPPPTGA